VNVMAPLASAFRSAGAADVLFLADGPAVRMLHDRGIDTQHFVKPASYVEAFDANHCAVLVVGTSANSSSVGLKLVDRARQSATISIGIVDAWMNAADRFRGNTPSSLTFAPDFIVATDKPTADEFLCLGYPLNQIRICGRPFYGLYPGLTTASEPVDASHGTSTEPLVCFLSEPTDGRGICQRHLDRALAWFCKATAFLPKVNRVLRLHPRSDPASVSKHADAFQCISSEGPISSWLWRSDLVVGMRGAGLIEAGMLNRRTISIGTDDDPRAIAVLADYGVQFANTEDQCCDLLRELLEGGQSPLPSKAQLEQITRRYTDGVLAACLDAPAIVATSRREQSRKTD
jgi:hypothetical protein